MRICDQRQIRIIIVVAVFFAIVIRLEYVLKLLTSIFSIIGPVITAFLCAITLDAPVTFLENGVGVCKRYKFGRTIAVIFVLIVVFISAIVLISIFIPRLFQSVELLFESLPRYYQRLNERILPLLQRYGLGLDALLRSVDFGNPSVLEYGTSALRKMVDSVSKGSRLFLSVGLAVYILLDKHKLLCLVERSKILFPDRCLRDKCYSILYQCAITYKRFISGQMLEGIILGVLCFIGMSIIGLPYALLISVFIGLTAVIPVIGAYIGAIPSALLLYLESPLQAGIFLLFLIPLQQFEGSVIYPRVVGEAVGISGFFVFLAIIIGSGIAGVMGVIVAVPLMAVVYDLVSAHLRRREAE